jgi:two-component system, cell cycle sensor histidine kinase and response regulator CckA
METKPPSEEALCRNALDGIKEGCILLGFNWRHIYINAIALKYSDRTKEELFNNSLMELYPGVEKTELFAGLLRCMHERVSQQVVFPFEYPDGTKRWFESSIQPIAEGIFVLTNDITERKRIEVEHDRLASAIEQSGECILILDTNRIVQYVNPIFEKLTGQKRKETIGRPLPNTDILNEEFHRAFWETLESGKPWKGRITSCKMDGSPITEDVTYSPVFDSDGHIVNYVGVSKDITEYLNLQNEKEKLQKQFLQAQKMESVGRLAGGVAHDFNNMLGVISGYTQLSLDTIDAGHPLYSNLREILKAAQRSTDLTRQLLAFARRQTIAPQILDLNSTIAGLLSMLKRLIGEDIDLAWRPADNLWLVRIDPAQIDQILANLAVNARDAIHKQGKVTIETQNLEFDAVYCTQNQGFVPGEYVMLALSDDGCGMDKKVLEHLFEPFFTTKKLGHGTGLGLATIYGIAKQNEGFINVYSEPGKGSTFKIYLPRYSGAEGTKIAEPKSDIPKGGTETILLVEDDEAVLNLAKIMLERLGYTVIAARIPSEAIRLASDYGKEIPLLLADVVMPEMTGRDLETYLLSLYPNLRTLFMSGYTANVIAHRGVLDDGVFFLQKPFSERDLAVKIRTVLENSR